MSDERTAFIAEEVELDDRGPVATGLFRGSVQTEDGGIHDAIDRDMSLAEAVRWSRERTDRVVVRVSGEEPYVDAGHGEDRALGRRRPAGWEFLDRTSADPPIMWDVIVERAADIPAGPVQPNGTWTGYATVPHSIVQVEAAGYEDALAAAVAGAPPELTATRAFPTGSRAARVNARLDADGIRF
jgi:hypothetical protein